MRSEGKEAAQRLKDSREMTMNKMRDSAAGLSLGDSFFAWDAARSVEGYYRIKGCTEVGAKQALARSPYADTVGMGSGKLILSQARQFSAEVEAAVPHQMLAYNQCPSFN